MFEQTFLESLSVKNENGSSSAVAACCNVLTARKVLGMSLQKTERESELM